MKKYSNCIDMMEVLERIGPLDRTLSNIGTDKALNILLEYMPEAKIVGFPSGQKIWGWEVPKRWNVVKAQIKSNGVVLVDFEWHPLHLLNYSIPFSGTINKEDLFEHLYSDPYNPDSIPFVFSFYEPKWGFCIPHSWREKFIYESYDIEINCSFDDGNMNVLEYFLPGDSEETIIFCNNICHPTQANDSLTGLVAAMDMMARLKSKKNRKYSYLFLVVPETIGSIAYLANNQDIIAKAKCGIVSEMLGTNGPIVAQQTQKGNSYLDFIMKQALLEQDEEHKVVDFLKSAGNDEKVLDSPGVGIPTISLTRYPYTEYHSSADNVGLISEERLKEARDVLQRIVDYLEKDYIPKLTYPGPVFLSGNGLYPDWRNDAQLEQHWLSFMDVMYSIDNESSVVHCAMKKNIPLEHFFYWLDAFIDKGLAKSSTYIWNK